MNIWKKFKVAIYLRLSKEDDDFKEESASITNQRNFLMNFIRANDNFIFMGEYVDDGFSGGDFEVSLKNFLSSYDFLIWFLTN